MRRLFATAALLALSAPAFAEELPNQSLTIKDHKFHPATIELPANTKVKLIVANMDATPEEFESKDLHREKVIQGGTKATMIIGPLKPGEYKYYGEFHEDTAQGKIVVK